MSYWMSGTEDLDYDVLLRWGTGTPNQGSEIALLLFIDGILVPWGSPTIWARDGITGKVGLVRW